MYISIIILLFVVLAQMIYKLNTGELQVELLNNTIEDSKIPFILLTISISIIIILVPYMVNDLEKILKLSDRTLNIIETISKWIITTLILYIIYKIYAVYVILKHGIKSVNEVLNITFSKLYTIEEKMLWFKKIKENITTVSEEQWEKFVANTNLNEIHTFTEACTYTQALLFEKQNYIEKYYEEFAKAYNDVTTPHYIPEMVSKIVNNVILNPYFLTVIAGGIATVLIKKYSDAFWSIIGKEDDYGEYVFKSIGETITSLNNTVKSITGLTEINSKNTEINEIISKLLRKDFTATTESINTITETVTTMLEQIENMKVNDITMEKEIAILKNSIEAIMEFITKIYS